MTFELGAVPESRVCQWVENVTERTESCFEFGAGLFTYVKATKSERKGGCEWFEPYYLAAKAECPDIEVIHEDMRRLDVLPNGYEVALFVDSLEHLKKADALALVKGCQERFKRIAIFIPVGKHDNPVSDGNKLQTHLSSWYPADLAKLGFEVTVDPHFHNTNPPEKQGAMFAVWNK